MSAVVLRRAVASEAIKLATLRSSVSSYVAIAGAFVLVAGVALTLPAGDGTAGSSSGDALLSLLVSVGLLVGIVGVVAGTAEYSAATIRATLTAVPSRLPVLAAKLLVHGGLVLFLMLPATLLGLVAGSVFAPDDIGPLTDGEVLRAIGGGVSTFVAASVLGLSLGVLTRSTAAAVGILFVLMFLPVLATVAPELTAFAPGRAAQAIAMPDNPPEAKLLDAGAAAVVLLGWVAGAVVVAALSLRRRDA